MKWLCCVIGHKWRYYKYDILTGKTDSWFNYCRCARCNTVSHTLHRKTMPMSSCEKPKENNMPKYVVFLHSPCEVVHIIASNNKSAKEMAQASSYAKAKRISHIELYDETCPEHQLPKESEYIYAVYCKYHEKPIRYMLPFENENFEGIKHRITNIYGKYLDKVEQIDKQNACTYMTEDGMRGLKSQEEIYHNYHGFLTLQEARTLWEATTVNSGLTGSKIDIMLLLKALHYYRAVHRLMME